MCLLVSPKVLKSQDKKAKSINYGKLSTDFDKLAPRAWNVKLNQILIGLRFHKCSKEPSLYRREDKTSLLVVLVYIDELLVMGSSLAAIEEFKREMSSKFEMSGLGKLTYYLGIEVTQYDGGIELRQSRYALKVLEESGMSECNPTQAPMELNIKLSKAIEEKNIDEKSIERI